MTTFVNITNHPSDKWSVEQTIAAGATSDRIEDIKFPIVDPTAGWSDITQMARNIAMPLIERKRNGERIIAHVMGEMTLTYWIVKYLQEEDIDCCASCTARDVKEVTSEDGTTKTVVFKFVQFRPY